jgi:hypothetical protein
MLIFNNNKPIKQKRWINTKVEFIWDGSQYVEQSAEGYWYDGEMALCQVNAETVDDSGDWGWWFRNTSGGDSGVYMAHSDAYGMHIHTGGATSGTYLMQMWSQLQNAAFIVKGDGKVGIGTNVPTQLLHLSSSATNELKMQVGDGMASSVTFTDGTDTWGIGMRSSTDNFVIAEELGVTGTERFVIKKTTGNVGIGTTSPGYNLEVAGTFYSAGSSIDYKKHVTDLDVDSSLIHSLRPVSYNYKKEYKDFGYNVKEGKQIGLVSEEVAETIPELAIMKDGRPKNVDYQKLAVILLKEVQNLKKEVEELKIK